MNSPREGDAPGTAADVERRIVAECEAVRDLLLAKNRRYGNSALAPLRVFSRADAAEQLRVRIDDKLSRIRTSGTDAPDEDTVLDLIGYLVLYRVQRRLADTAAAAPAPER